MLVGHHVTAFVARAAVPLHLIELFAALDEPVNQAFEVLGREVLEMVLVPGSRRGHGALFLVLSILPQVPRSQEGYRQS